MSRDREIIIHYPRSPAHREDAGALRVWRLMLEWRRRGWGMAFACPAQADAYLAELSAAGVRCLSCDGVDDPSWLEYMSEGAPRAAIFCHHPIEHQFAEVYARRHPKTIRVFDTVDLFFLRRARQQRVAAGRASGAAVAQDEAPALSDLDDEGLDELLSIARSDATLVVSDFERDLLVRAYGFDAERLAIVSNVHDAEAETRPFESRGGFMFLGGFRHEPNLDAVLWMAAEVWPGIRARLPRATWRIYGSHAPASVTALNDASRGIEVHGFVEDHRAALGAARVLLCPLRFGAGVKGKIGEALACGTAVVTNAIGAEGIDPEGEALAIGETPDALVELAVQLHEKREAWQARTSAGRGVLERRFSARANVDALIRAIESAEARRGAGGPWAVQQALLWHAGRAGATSGESCGARHSASTPAVSPAMGPLVETLAVTDLQLVRPMHQASIEPATDGVAVVTCEGADPQLALRPSLVLPSQAGTVIEIVLAVDQPARAQLYLDAGAGMSEDRSHRWTILRAGEDVTWRGVLPEGVVGLRLDPMDRPGVARIRSIRFYAPP